jgi:predicted PurR-regulated permease PerM
MSRRQDLGRVTLTVLFIGGLMVGSFWVMQPFLPAILWATTIVLATWPLMLWVQRHTGNRRGVAVLFMTVAILLVLIIPIWLAVSTVVTNIDVLRKGKGRLATRLLVFVDELLSWREAATGRAARTPGAGS